MYDALMTLSPLAAVIFFAALLLVGNVIAAKLDKDE